VVRRLAGGSGKADRWELTDQAKRWLDETLPVLSESTDISSLQTKIMNDDKTGKVPPC